MNSPAKGRPKILVLLKTLGVGGAENLVLRSATLWDRGAFEYELAYLGGPTPLENFFRELGFPPRRLSPSGWADDPRSITVLRKHVASAGVDLIHAHLPVPTLTAILARRGLPVRLVATNHSLPDVLHPVTRTLSPYLWKRTDRAIAVSKHVAQGMRGTNHLEIIANGVALKSFEVVPAELPGIPKDAPVILVLGSLLANKRPLEALHVFEKALEKEAALGAHLAFAGTGPLEKALNEARKHSSLKARIHILGERHDVPALVNRASVCMLLSRSEGLPMALLEAAAGGAALLATRVGSIPEIVIEGETGYLVESPADAPARLAVLLAAPETARKMGAAARERVRLKFDLSRNVRRTEAIYEELL